VKQSETLAALAPALAAAQSELKAVSKDRTNPHFKNKYATLDAIMDEIRPVLAKHGLSVVQGMAHPDTDVNGVVKAFVLETMLLHKSGEYLANAAVMPVAKNDPQGVGSAITYGRRYGVSALLALATDEDDDGNHGSDRPTSSSSRPAPAASMGNGDAPTEKQVGFLHKLLQSSVFTDEERKKYEAAATSKARAKAAIEWAQQEIESRKAAA
jgi:hypothetical protein